MENMDVRLKARGAGVPLWQIADRLGVSEPTLTRWMRQKLPKEKKSQILSTIREIEKEVMTNRG